MAFLFVIQHLLVQFLIRKGGVFLEKRIALVGIIVENPEAAEKINAILHEFSAWIVGRMGIPYRDRGVSIICVVVDAPNNTISAMSGKLGMIEGISVKTVYQKAGENT